MKSNTKFGIGFALSGVALAAVIGATAYLKLVHEPACEVEAVRLIEGSLRHAPEDWEETRHGGLYHKTTGFRVEHDGSAAWSGRNLAYTDACQTRLKRAVLAANIAIDGIERREARARADQLTRFADQQARAGATSLERLDRDLNDALDRAPASAGVR